MYIVNDGGLRLQPANPEIFVLKRHPSGLPSDFIFYSWDGELGFILYWGDSPPKSWHDYLPKQR